MLALVGGLLQTGLALALWPVQRFEPERRALERDEKEIARWKREEWPRIKKGSRAKS